MNTNYIFVRNIRISSYSHIISQCTEPFLCTFILTVKWSKYFVFNTLTLDGHKICDKTERAGPPTSFQPVGRRHIVNVDSNIFSKLQKIFMSTGEEN